MFLKLDGLLSGLLVIFLILAVFLLWGPTLDGVLMIIMAYLCCAISLYDLKRGIIPNKFIIFGLIIQMVAIWIKENSIFKVGIAICSGLLIAFVVLLIVSIVDRMLKTPSMGGGDIKLILMLGMMTSVFQSFLALFLSCIIGLVLYKFRKKNIPIPFAPALCTGWFIICCINQFFD